MRASAIVVSLVVALSTVPGRICAAFDFEVVPVDSGCRTTSSLPMLIAEASAGGATPFRGVLISMVEVFKYEQERTE